MIIENPGVILLRLRSSFVRLQRVLPLPKDLREKISADEDPVPHGGREIEWPLIVERQQDWQKDQFEIEPGESDQVAWDFILKREVVGTVEVYSYFKNESKRSRNIGWGLTTLYDFESGVESTITRTVEALSGKGGNEYGEAPAGP